MAAPGVRGQDGVSRQDSEAAFARNERKASSFARDSEGAFGSESATRGGESAIRRGSFWTRIRWGKAVAAPGVRGQGCASKNERKLPFFSRDSESAFGSESAIRGGSFWTRIRWGKAVAAPGVRGQDAREKWKKTFFSRDSEAAFGSESATRGGSFWTRIRWGKAVAAPGVRGQERKEKGLILIGIQRARLGAKVQSGEARFRLEIDGGSRPGCARKMEENFFFF